MVAGALARVSCRLCVPQESDEDKSDYNLVVDEVSPAQPPPL